MSKKIMGVTVGTSLSPSKIEEKIKPIKTVNNVAPDENGNVEIKIPEGADGKTPYIKNGNWWIGETDTGVKAEGKEGKKGRGISSILKVSTNGLVDTYSIIFTDETSEEFTVTNGADGKDGKDGANGKDGVDGKDYVLTPADKTEMAEQAVKLIDGVPDYWLSALEEGAKEINTALCTAGCNKSAFLFYSDVHWNYGSQKSPILLKYLYKHTGMTKTIFGGDIVNDEATNYDTMAYLWEWRNMLKDLPNHHSVVGNHDDGNPNTIFDEKYVYGYLFAPEETPDIVMGDGMYYYIDNPSEKTRYLYLDTAFKGVDDKQKEFIKQVLIDTPSGWHIVAIAHIWYQPDYTQGDIRPMPISGLDSGASQIVTMLDAYNSRNGDYVECEGKVEFCIGGHVHQDYVNTTTSGIPIILVETDSKHVRSALSYTAGTTTEASVNGIIADYNTNKVNVIRIGRGSSFIVDIATGNTEEPDIPDVPDTPEPIYTNLFVAEEATNGFRLNSSGILTQSDADLTTGFIKVQPNTSYIIRVKNRVSGGSVSIGRLSEYSTANESSHKIQYKCTETDDYSYENNYEIFVFPFTTSDITEFIRLTIISGANCDFIITLNEPIV